MDVLSNVELKRVGLVHQHSFLHVEEYVAMEWSNQEKFVTMEDLTIYQIAWQIAWDQLLGIHVIMEHQLLLQFVMKFVGIEC